MTDESDVVAPLQSLEERGFVEQAMRCVEANSAGHWPTVAGYLHDEVLRLRAQVELMSRALQATAYIDRDKLMSSLDAAQPPTSEASPQ